MPLKYNYHMHTELCKHAVGSIEDNVNMAISLGYEEIGFSEHAPLPLEAFNEEDNKRLYAYENISMEELENDYLDKLHNLQKNSKISIKIGLETEYLEEYLKLYETLADKVEYMVLGMHFFKMDGRFIDTYAEIDNKTMYGYANAVSKALDTGLFKILAHPDLYLYDDIEFDSDAKKVADIIIDSAIKNNVYVEINCNGKGHYPRKDFYNYIKDKNCKFIIGVDSHDPRRLSGYHIEDSIKLANELNIKLEDKIEVAE